MTQIFKRHTCVEFCGEIKPSQGLSRLTCILLTLLLAVSIAMHPVLFAQDAYADVRKADIVAGATQEQRGMPPSMCPSIDAERAYLVDENGRIYFERNANEECTIASITKIMTAIIAMENAPMDLEMSVSKEAATVGESSANLMFGDVITLENALYALMVPSGNDAAIVISEGVGQVILENAANSDESLVDSYGNTIEGTSVDECNRAFLAKMNSKAIELGCSNTFFTNPHGLDGGKYGTELHSTAKDVSIISAYAMQSEQFREIVDTEKKVFPVKRNGQNVDVEVVTTDVLLGEYTGSCGIKTGHTDLAGYCFSGACERDGITLYAIVLGSTSSEQRFADTEILYNWVYNNTVDYKLANTDEVYEMTFDGDEQSVPVVAYAALSDWEDKTVPVTFKDPDVSVSIFKPDGNISQEFHIDEIHGGVSAGQVVGTATFYQHNEEIATLDLIACADVQGPSILESIGIWWNRLTGSNDGENEAKTVVINETPVVLDKVNP